MEKKVKTANTFNEKIYFHIKIHSFKYKQFQKYKGGSQRAFHRVCLQGLAIVPHSHKSFPDVMNQWAVSWDIGFVNRLRT